MGSSQPGLENVFDFQLQMTGRTSSGEAGTGMLIAGGFGSGKSHLLWSILKHIALEENYVCSKIVISKETPLYHPAKVYQAAMEPRWSQKEGFGFN